MKEDNNLDVLNKVVNALMGLEKEDQVRLLQAAVTLLDIQWPNQVANFKASEVSTNSNRGISFSEDRSLSAKEFLRDKLPRTDIERVACLAYYLTHYREVQHFKTIDLSTLNTEAAQPKFSNAHLAVNNATIAGLLVPAGKGSKQISAAGEVFVSALPDRSAAKESLANLRLKKRGKKSAKKQ